MENIYIYKITNKLNNSIYIGIRKVKGDIHKDNYKGEHTVLRKELRKHGKKSFSTEILAKDLTEGLANNLIREYKKILKATILEDILDKNELRMASQKGKSSGRKRKVICLNNEKVFDSTVEASTYYGLKRTSVAKACSKGVFAGKDLETGEKLKWMYYDVYLGSKEENIENKNIEKEEVVQDNLECVANTPSTENTSDTSDVGNVYIPSEEEKILCITTDKTFGSIQEASDYYGVSASAIERCCAGRRSFAGLDNNGNKLTWKYLK